MVAIIGLVASLLSGQGVRYIASPPFEKCMQVDPQLMEGQAAAGIAQGEFCVGYYLMEGKAGRVKNQAEGLRYFKKAAARGHVDATGFVGYFYKHGLGVAVDFREAEKWYRMAAERGAAMWQNDLAVLYMYGGPGLQKNKAEALKWATLASQQNFAPAFNTLTAINNMDRPVRVEPGQEFMQEADRLYRAGNRAAAVKPYLAAARAGNSVAQYQLGWHYENGVGVPRNMVEAATWYRRSADQGHSLAMKAVGAMYENGTGVGEDWIQAARWYQKSADLGDPYGQAALASAYQFGIGVHQHRRAAVFWHERAASRIPDSARFARSLKDSTNFIGFRNPEEHQLVIGNKLRFGSELTGGDPTGLRFRNSSERMNWLLGQRQRIDYDEAMTLWGGRRQEYDTCMAGGGRNCTDPGPPPSPPR